MKKSNDIMEENFISVLCDNLSKINISADTRDRIIKFSPFIINPEHKFKNENDLSFVFKINSKQFKLIQAVYKARGFDANYEKFKAEFLRTAIEIAAIYFCHNFGRWFTVSYDEARGLDADGMNVIYVITLKRITDDNLREYVKNLISKIIFDVLQSLIVSSTHPRLHLSKVTDSHIHYLVEPTKTFYETKKRYNIDNFLDSLSHCTRNVIEDLKILGLLSRDGIPEVDILTFIRETTKYLQKDFSTVRKRWEQSVRKGKQLSMSVAIKEIRQLRNNMKGKKILCKYCGEFFIPETERKDLGWCKKPKCKMAAWRERQRS